MAEMSKFSQNALGLATGIIFGALLQRGRLADSRTIVGQLTGDDSRVAKTMGMAVAVAAVGHRLLRRRGLATAEPKPMNPVGLVGGAVLFGAGMALSGYCPGTAAAAAGSGRREGVWAMAGMLAAAAVFVATYPRLKKALEFGSLGRVNLLGGNPARHAPPLDVAVRPRAAPDTGLPLEEGIKRGGIVRGVASRSDEDARHFETRWHEHLGRHVIGPGAGATAGALTGAGPGAVGGPVGMAAGVAIGAVADGLAGKGAAEVVNPKCGDDLADYNVATGVGAGGAAVAGAAVGSVAGPVGMAAGAAIGAAAGGAAGKGTGGLVNPKDEEGPRA